MGKYKVGDKVRVRKDLVVGAYYGGQLFADDMERLCGKKVTIESVRDEGVYRIVEYDYNWTDEMFEDINKPEYLANIARIVRNKETTVIFWEDDTKTIVKLGENQTDSPEMAILWAFFEKNSGLTKTQAHKIMSKLIDSIHNQNKKKIELPKKKDFKIGDKVRLLSHGYTNAFEIGEIYQIANILQYVDYNIVIKNEDSIPGYVKPKNIEKV